VDTRFEVRPISLEYLVEISIIENLSHITPWTDQQIAEEFCREGAYNFAVFENNKLLGYFFSYIFLDELHILNLSVEEKSRKQGLAMLLIDFTTHAAKSVGVSKVFLECRESDTAARSLYTKCGFLLNGRRKSYYSLGSSKTSGDSLREDGLLFIKEL
jgi:ribosomal-protein-alanine N-acetyltransferase